MGLAVAQSSLPEEGNSKGNFVGMYQVVAGGLSHAFVFSAGGFESLDVPGAAISAAHATNSRGQILGCFDTPEGRRYEIIAVSLKASQ